MINILSALFILSHLLLIDGSRYNVDFSVIDGDTLTAKDNKGQKFKIRMLSIDDPESRQKCLDKNKIMSSLAV